MRDDGQEIDGHLTWQVFAEIWQLAVSDRRRLADHFPFLDKVGLREDSVFYPTVLEHMRADAKWAAALQRAFWTMPRQKDRQRSFFARSFRWLESRIEGLEFGKPGEPVHPDPITWPPLEREVYELALTAFIELDEPRLDCEAEDAEPSADEIHNWTSLVERMQTVLSGMGSPDVGAARLLADLADALVRSCDRAAAEAEARHAADLDARRSAIVRSISGLGLGSEDTAILLALGWVVDPELMAEVEALVGGVMPLSDAVSQAEVQFAEAEENMVRVGADPDASRVEKRVARDAVDAADAVLTVASDSLRDALSELVADLRRLSEENPVAEPVKLAGVGPTAVIGLGVTSVAGESEDEEEEEEEEEEDGTEDVRGEVDAVPEGPILQYVPAERPKVASAGFAEASADFAQQTEAGTVLAGHGQDGNVQDGNGQVDTSSTDPAGSEPSAALILDAVEDAARELAAVWTGRRPLDEVMTRYFDQGELALACHLAELAEENGLVPPVPSILLKSLVASGVLTGPYDLAAQTLGEWLAAAMAEVEAAETRGVTAGLRARSVALAALLRPALMARDTNARDHLRALSLADGLQAYGPVVTLLRDLRRDLQPSLSDLAELAGGEKQRRLPGALADIREWLPGARTAQSMHAPSGVIVRRLLDVQGVVGRLFEAALAGQIDLVDATHGWLLQLSGDKTVAEDLVAAEEREIGRPKRDSIKGLALEWIVRKLRDGADLLLAWRAAYHEDQEGDTRRLATLAPSISELKKKLGPLQQEITVDEGVDAAVQRLLGRTVADFLQVLEGRANQTTVRPTDALDAAILRLPGICQPYALDDAAFDAERGAQRRELYLALQRPDAVPRDEVTALALHLEDQAILPAQILIGRLERQGILTQAEAQGRRMAMENVLYNARTEAHRAIIGLRHDLEPLQSIDLATSPEIQLWLDRLSLIDRALEGSGDLALPMQDRHRSQAIPPDFPHLRHLLDEARDLRDRVRNGIRDDQRERLEGLAGTLQNRGKTELAVEALEVARSLDARDPITVEDILIRLQNGQSHALTADAPEDSFATFYPGFVSALTSEIETVAIQSALKSGGVAGPLDYRGLEEHEIKRAVELDTTWRTLANAFQKSRDIGLALQSFMERLGFTSVVIERETQLSAQLRWMWMRANRLSAQDWFLPPVFGSEADGSYPVFLAHRNVEDAQLVAEMAKIGRDAPCVLLVFGRLSKARRESFGLAMRRAKQTVLLIDEAQILYLTTGGDWMRRLFACAAPFGYLQPYTTSAGNIPVEMFFGRETEIAKIESTTADGCLVYGGRQLGKSALLHHVRKRFHQPVTGRHAYYLKIDEFGGPVQPAAQIWNVIRRSLVEDQILPRTAETPDNIRSGILDWLGRGGERRILLLVDEADLFLSSEARSGFPNLNPLKDLMEETQRRFKIVFAGLHNVRRMAKAPNSPLVHLSEPICIGPLNTTSDSSQQARRLVVEPMKAAGFDYEKPELIHSLLTRVNFYPSLMQVFLKALLEGLSNQARPQGTGPRWVLREEQLFRGPSSEGINSQIRERFQWTLNLDPRYELIAKVVARHRILSVDAEGGTMTADAVQREAENYWPKGQEKLSRMDFPAFLDEMVDLGVLIRLPGPPVRYGLRGAQVAQMLGQLDQLDDEILKIADKEPRVDYDPNHYHRRVGSDQHIDRRAPLPDRTIAALFDTDTPGVRILIAAPAVLGSDQTSVLAELASGWNDGKGLLSGEVFRGQEADLRRLVDRATRRKVLVLQAQGAKPDWITWLAAHPAVCDGRLLPVFVGAPDVVERLLPRTISQGVQVFRARPWERTMLRAWLSDSGLSLLDTPETREALLDVTGGAPAALSQMRQGLEALVAGGHRDDIAARVRELGKDISFSPAQIGLPAKLVPLFCNAAELVDGAGEAEETLIDLLASDSPDAAADIGQMTELGLFHQPEPAVIALSPMGALLYLVCNAPGRPG